MHDAPVSFQIDQQHSAGIDLVVVGGFWRAGVPDAAGGAFIGDRVAVAECHIVNLASGNALFEATQRNKRGVSSVGRTRVEPPMSDDHAKGVRGTSQLDGTVHQIDQRPFRSPRRSQQLDPVRDFGRLAAVQNDDIRGSPIAEGMGGVDRRGIQRIVIAGQQVEGHLWRVPHRLEGSGEHLAVDLIRLENVTADQHELASLLDCKLTDAPDCIEPCLAEPGLRFPPQEVTRHPELPIGGVKELHDARP